MGRSRQNSKKSSGANKNKSIGKKATGWLSDIRQGKTVSVNFFKHNAWLLITFIAIVLSLMGMRYKTKTKMEHIKVLEKELIKSETEKLREKAAYMSLIRESEMLRLVEKNRMGLVFQEQPPFEITLYTEE